MRLQYMTARFDCGDSKRNRGAFTRPNATRILTNPLCNRMRNATILVVRLRGVATEVIKNIVLAGIGKLVILDDEVVTEEDLGAGFFFRDEDVGKKVS
jgi:molybdopterin/thiamine biosynthesis adenylyltransferase